jgi:hypothetical protein
MLTYADVLCMCRQVHSCEASDAKGPHGGCGVGSPGAAARDRSALRYLVYLLYWYKSTNTATEGAAARDRSALRYSVYMLYWYTSTNTDAALQFRHFERSIFSAVARFFY